MDKAVNTFLPRIQQWLKQQQSAPETADASAAVRKPLLVFGPYQSGKKTILRMILRDRLRYNLIEPDANDDFSKFADTSLLGKNAYLLRVDTVGLKRMPAQIRSAPVLYVCHSPYDHGTKDELMRRFQFFDMASTGVKIRNRMESDKRDVSLTFWHATDDIRTHTVDQALADVDMVDPFFTEIVHMSYCNTVPASSEVTESSLRAMVAATEWLALSDTFARKLPQDAQRLAAVVAPIKTVQLQSRHLLFKRAELPRNVKLAKSPKKGDFDWFSDLAPIATVTAAAAAPPTTVTLKQTNSTTRKRKKKQQLPPQKTTATPRIETFMRPVAPVVVPAVSAAPPPPPPPPVEKKALTPALALMMSWLESPPLSMNVSVSTTTKANEDDLF
jgi:hypothetical protein